MRLVLIGLLFLVAPHPPDAQILVRDAGTSLWGVQSEGGEWIVPPTFDAVEEPWTDPDTDDVYVRVHAGGSMGLLRNGRLILPTRFETIGSTPLNRWQPTLFAIAEPRILAETADGKKGLYRLDGEEVMAPVHEDIDPGGLYVVVYVGAYEDDLYTLDGERVGERYARVRYATEATGLSTPVTYQVPDGAYDPDRDVLVVRSERRGPVRLLRASTRVPITLDTFDGVQTMAGAIAVTVRRGGRSEVSLIDYDGETLLTGPFGQAQSLRQAGPDRFIAVERDGRWHLADLAERTVTDAGFEALGSPAFSSPPTPGNEFFLAKEDGLWGVVDPDGAWLVAPEYDRLANYQRRDHSLSFNRGEERGRIQIGG